MKVVPISMRDVVLINQEAAIHMPNHGIMVIGGLDSGFTDNEEEILRNYQLSYDFSGNNKTGSPERKRANGWLFP